MPVSVAHSRRCYHSMYLLHKICSMKLKIQRTHVKQYVSATKIFSTIVIVTRNLR
jgi:hypothetical protein